MGRIVKRVVLATLGLVALALVALAVANAVETARRDRLYVDNTLGQAEKAELAEALALKSALGDEAWPGLASADIPLILFNDRYEFLVGLSDPPAPWTAVEGDDFAGQTYYRRTADKPQAFAVRVGDRWAGSLGQLERMNREYLLGVREQLPPVLAHLFPYPFATLSRDKHVAAILHEAFHAYQATTAPSVFARANGRYSLERAYPYESVAFEAAWSDEGSRLLAAVQAADDATAGEHAVSFLQARQSRRLAASLSDDLVGYERDLEWLEGLAKHVEMKVHELAAVRGASLGLTGYDAGASFWRQELEGLSRLGDRDGDYRFYLSGMAQARLLDRLAPGWTARALAEGVALESLLAEAVGKGE